MSKIVDVILHSSDKIVQVMVVVDKLPEFKYEMIKDTNAWGKSTNFLYAEDGPFSSAYEGPHGSGAFGGRKFDIPMKDGSVTKASGQWWDAYPQSKGKGRTSIGYGTIEGLSDCNVFSAGTIDACHILDWVKNNDPSNNYNLYRNPESSFGTRERIIESKHTNPIQSNCFWAERGIYCHIAQILKDRGFPCRDIIS